MKANLLGSIILLLVALSPAQAEEPGKVLGVAEAVQMALASNLNLRLQKEELARSQGAALAEEGTFDVNLSAAAKNREQEFTSMGLGSPTAETSTEWNARLQKRLTTGTELDLNWQNNRSDTDSSFTTLNPAYNTGVSLGLSQPLLRGRGSAVQTAELKAAQRQAEATTFLVDSRAADLVAEVKKAYWDLVFAWQDIEVKKLSQNLAEKLRDETRDKIEAGALAAVEIFEPESEVARREQQLIAGERAIGTAEDELRLLLNMEDWDLALTLRDLPQFTNQAQNFDEVLVNALNNRADIKAAERQIDAAHLATLVARNRTLPSLNLEGAVGVSGTDATYGSAFDNATDESDTVWQVGIVFSTSLGSRQAKGNYQQAKANLAKAKTQVALLRQQVRRQAREAVRAESLAIKGVEAAEKTSHATLKRLEAEQEKFNVGLATANNVLESQEAYSEALSSEHSVRREYAKALAELDRVQGRASL